MKREYHQLRRTPADHSMAASSSSGGIGASGYSMAACGKSKLWEEEAQDGGMDELLAVLGYKVKSSDMAEVAQKLEQLEEALGNVQDGVTQLSSDTVHYNPSDLSTWLESMLTELNPSPNFGPISAAAAAGPPPHPPASLEVLAPAESSTITSIDFTDNSHQQQMNIPNTISFEDESSSDYELKAIPGKAIFNQPQKQQLESPSSRETKRLKTSNTELYTNSSMTTTFGVTNDSTRPVVLIDSQENGIRLVHALMACAEAVQRNNLKLAEALVNKIGFLAVSQAGAMRKVATYFAEALARRIYRLYPENPMDRSLSDMLQIHFYETSNSLTSLQTKPFSKRSKGKGEFM